MGLPKGRTNNLKGRTKGTKNERTKQWEELADTITGLHSERFNAILEDFMCSENIQLQEKGCTLYLQALEYFKPKQARVTHAGEKESPIQIIIPPSV